MPAEDDLEPELVQFENRKQSFVLILRFYPIFGQSQGDKKKEEKQKKER